MINNIKFAYFKKFSFKNELLPAIHRGLNNKWQWEITFWEHANFSKKKFEGSLIVFLIYNLFIFDQNEINYSNRCLKKLKYYQKWKINFNFPQKGDSLGGIILSLNTIERLLISSPPKKDIQILKYLIFWYSSRFYMNI